MGIGWRGKGDEKRRRNLEETEEEIGESAWEERKTRKEEMDEKEDEI